jgi:hypothetical protein
MYPGEDVSDWHSYEGFGTHMSETLLMSLGYFSDEELEARRGKNLPLPPTSLWVGNSMRRPFALVGNAIASIRTLREGELGAKVQERLGREGFNGLRLSCTGGIPQGGFSSSSALTLATKNAIDKLFDFGIPADMMIHLACQAEYGTGVRAGSLDQATEQKGVLGQGTLISSNPADKYRILGTYPVPAQRFRMIFPYSAERDRGAWRWSWGMYAQAAVPDAALTAGEIRKMTGKSAELAAILTRLPLDVDFFKVVEDELLRDGCLGRESRSWICGILRQVPLLIRHFDLQVRVKERREWCVEELVRTKGLDGSAARLKADSLLSSLFDGWREPVFRRRNSQGQAVREAGVPLRAMLGYLFCEVAKNFRLIHHPEQWIECVTRSQRGDRCVEIDSALLPDRKAMEGGLEWEEGTAGPDRLHRWLQHFEATPFDYDQDLDDATLSPENPPEFHLLGGTNLFRGLALIDLAEAMLKRAFGGDAVAVRINAAGQGDYFQVHIDTQKADPEEVKRFLRAAFYRRFDLKPEPEFVEPHPGGGACGIRLSRYDRLPHLIDRLQEAAT